MQKYGRGSKKCPERVGDTNLLDVRRAMRKSPPPTRSIEQDTSSSTERLTSVSWTCRMSRAVVECKVAQPRDESFLVAIANEAEDH